MKDCVEDKKQEKLLPAVLHGGQQQNNQSTTFDQLKHQTKFQLLLNSVKRSLDQKSTKNQNDRQQIYLTENQGPVGAQQSQKQLVSPKPALYPMAASAYGRKQAESQEMASIGEEIEGKVLPEKSGVDSAYKPGRGIQRLNQYMSQLNNVPKHNHIQFWRTLVAEFFAPYSKIRWCVSSYRNIKQISNLFKLPWQCNMCNVKPCCGFHIIEELLPRLYKIKYEYHGSCGRIFLHYPEAAEESEHEQARITCNGQFHVVFPPDLRICSWEFCTQHHEEYIRRTSAFPQESELFILALMNIWIANTRNLYTWRFISSAYQMVEALGTPFTSQIGVAKLYERCQQVLD
ncbi:hypothetical protein CDL12_21931 [Handroanthus impetiginosus]|uniref:Uncharacterized protein n=1 Tax=Handroanthus impetiginosus TaxID=429701 RepID=A0A2G9GJU9_9LAMI|nr:hypothetical protein CDL12_21931 [Handroanthus impetiginosus]